MNLSSALDWEQYCGAHELLVLGRVVLGVTGWLGMVSWLLGVLRALSRAFSFPPREL